jgi:hypothetical protein
VIQETVYAPYWQVSVSAGAEQPSTGEERQGTGARKLADG